MEQYADQIDCCDGNGGYAIEDVFESVLIYFDEEISEEEAVKIVQANRTKYEEEMYEN